MVSKDPSVKVTKSNEWKPHAKQIKMAELLLNPEDRRTKQDKCKEVWYYHENPLEVDEG